MSAIAAAMLALVVQAVRPLPHEDDEAARRRAWRTPSLLLSGESLELDLVGRHPLRAPSVRAGREPSGGEAPEPLARWAAVAITADGRALVQDEGTGEVHVFGPG